MAGEGGIHEKGGTLNPPRSSQNQGKNQIRGRLRQAVAGMAERDKQRYSQAICLALEASEPWRKAAVVLGYMPLADEPDIGQLLVKALVLGKSLGLPAYDEGTNAYGMRRVRDLDRDLIPGKFGILEPTNECSMLSLNRLDLALVPGVGFSPCGCRLGRGNGFYDRLLGQTVAIKCGVAFDCQVEIELPMEPHDVGMNCIVTPTRWMTCQPGSIH